MPKKAKKHATTAMERLENAKSKLRKNLGTGGLDKAAKALKKREDRLKNI